MFWVFNKDKIMSYLVTVFTVAVLFLTASTFGETEEIIETSANNYEPENNMNTINEEKINNVLNILTN